MQLLTFNTSFGYNKTQKQMFALFLAAEISTLHVV